MSPRRKNKKNVVVKPTQMNVVEFSAEELFKEHQKQHSQIEYHTADHQDYSHFNVAAIIKEEMKVLNNFPESENDEVGHSSKKQPKQQQQNKLAQHTDTHKESAFACNVCGKLFKSKYNLKYHEDEHVTGGHTCHICYKSFAIAARLKQHMKIHEEDIYECKTCYKSFKCPYRLKYHSLIHTDQRKECPVDGCNKVFALQSQLNQHLETHTADWNFHCDQCDKKFKNKYRLKYHQMSHAQESGFACMLCSKAFSEPALLKQHMLVHQEVGNHQCTVCFRKFKRKNTLKLHAEKHHKTTLYNL